MGIIFHGKLIYLCILIEPNPNIMNIQMLSVAATFAAFTLVSCGDTATDTAQAPQTSQERTTGTPVAQEVTYEIDPAASKITWRGTMLGVKSHHGTVDQTEGHLVVADGQLTGGHFVVDLNSIRPLDENYAPETEEQGTRSKLIGHLKSPDFFDVATHPTATLRILEASGNTAKAEFTVRGKTSTETIENIQITENNGVVNATGKMTFDRQKYDVKWDSGVQEAVLSNDIELEVELTGRAQTI